jgi:hypothetical protein
MRRFEPGERVIFEKDGVRHRGRVSCMLNRRRGVVTDTGRRLQVPVTRLRYSPDRALILETRLDRSLRSRRTYAPMLKQWLSAYGVEALHERVHTREDLKRFLAKEGRLVSTRFVHIFAHGEKARGRTGARLKLTFESIDLREEAALFGGLRGKVIIFSSCNLGSDLEALKAVKEASRAAVVVGYRVPVEDSYTNLHEALLYERLLRSRRSPLKAVQEVSQHLYDLGVRPHGIIIRKPVMVGL